ncbi:MAG TPA: electron transfer flavoprotein subunit beta/FixA family protein [Vicinamibacterales bacterium]|nr:electron transfer flavoprotein subunit beta/FixA family protein [Vicinamibacterales bacterium]
MKIAVCIKQVVTREWQLRVSEAKTWIRDQDASFELNEPDAYALEEALRLKEKHGGEVVVVSAGPARATQVLREALARGADRAIHVEADALAAADAFVVADALAGAIRDEGFDLVLTGLQSDDQGFGQVGVVLAEKLGMPHATIIMEVQADPSTGSGQAGLRVKRELEGGWFQWMTLPLPALLTIQSGINQLRYATLKGIMAAKKKEIRKVAPAGSATPAQNIAAVYFPEKGKKTQMLAGSPAEAAKALIQKLRDEARVIGH